MMERDYHRQLLLSNDVNGRPFAFVPILSRLYHLKKEELIDFTVNDYSFLLTDLSAVPAIEDDYRNELNTKGIDSLHRRHTPGVALVTTQQCNLSCSYCLAKQGTFGLPIATMNTTEILQRLKLLFEMEPNIDFIKFFGGEPTLRMDLIEEVCAYVTNTLGKKVHFGLTTNGTQNAASHIEIWKRYHVSVSVSIDGPPHIHDAVRMRKDGRGSHKEALTYCENLREYGFPFAIVSVFDDRHIKSGYTYLDTIKYLNKFSPLVKVQFVEALGDAAQGGGISPFSIKEARKQIESAVDSIMTMISNNFVEWENGEDQWLYDNNLFRFMYGIVKELARPYEDACTASQLTTVFPSGDMTACYTFSERKKLHLGGLDTNNTDLLENKNRFREHYKWEKLSSLGVDVPWYRGVVGDICVSDMMNSPYARLQQSDFYKVFQEIAVLRILQHLPVFKDDVIKHARLLHAIEKHRILTGEYTRRGITAT